MTTPAPPAEEKALLPCPFCGGDGVYCYNVANKSKPMHWVLCRDCYASPGDKQTEVAAKSLWNARALPEQPVGWRLGKPRGEFCEGLPYQRFGPPVIFPGFESEDELAKWIGEVRAAAFLNGARHGEIDQHEARAMLRAMLAAAPARLVDD